MTTSSPAIARTRKKAKHRRPVVGRPIGQQKRDFRRGGSSRAPSPQFARRAAVELLKRLVEPPHAAKAAGQRDLDHGEIGLMDQLLGKQHAAGLRDRDGRGSDVLAKEPAKLPLADLEPIGQ